jgi:pimeloyl-ACP methyl ester carboxylesterase
MPIDDPTPLRRWLLRFVRRLLAVLVPLIAILLVGPLGLLTIIAETRAGRLVGWLALTVIGTLICGAALSWPVGPRRVGWSALAACLLAAGGLLAVLARVQHPVPIDNETGLRSVVLGPSERTRPGLLGHLPEIDLVKLGATIGSRLIPGIDHAHARRIRVETTRLYREVEADDAGKSLPSLAHLALDELIGRPFDAGHYFAYLPPSVDGERLGAIVFLHGNAGNLKILPWAWRPFADSHRVAIICPTFGFGMWGQGGAEAVDRVLNDALQRFPIDPNRVYLAGISDGGNGVTRTATAHPTRFQGLIYVSPTMRVDELSEPVFADAWRGRPVLVLQGDNDVNVRKQDVDPAVDRLRSQGVAVTYKVYPGEDHFLFFGRSAEVFEAISAWNDQPPRRLPASQVH